jgi:CHASE3 domain sensor protein
LKSTLDDQVRRSSSLLQSLQSHNSMVENMVKSHMKEIQREISEKIDQKFDEIIQRISSLEGTSNHQGSPSSSSASPALNGTKVSSADAVLQPDTASKKKRNHS